MKCAECEQPARQTQTEQWCVEGIAAASLTSINLIKTNTHQYVFYIHCHYHSPMKTTLRNAVILTLLSSGAAWLPAPKPSKQPSLSKPSPTSPKPSTDLDSTITPDAFGVKHNDDMDFTQTALSVVAAAVVALSAVWVVNEINIPTLQADQLALELKNGAVERVQFSGSDLGTVHVVYKDGSAARVNAVTAAVLEQCETYQVPSNFVEAAREQKALWQAEDEAMDASLDAYFVVNSGFL